MGNRMSYKDFLTRNRDKGVHSITDLTDFGLINKRTEQKTKEIGH